jgi:hypothetical protein
MKSKLVKMAFGFSMVLSVMSVSAFADDSTPPGPAQEIYTNLNVNSSLVGTSMNVKTVGSLSCTESSTDGKTFTYNCSLHASDDNSDMDLKSIYNAMKASEVSALPIDGHKTWSKTLGSLTCFESDAVLHHNFSCTIGI